MPGALEFTVYDQAFRRVGLLGDPASCTVALKRNAVSTATFEVPEVHEYIDVLSRSGARVVIDYRLADGSLKRLLSGPVDESSGEVGPAAGRTFTVLDDWWLLTGILGWPNPAGPLAQQGDEDAYDTRTGPAENVAKAFVRANAPRHGLPLAVAADQGRGSSVTVAMRMHPLADRLFPAVTQAGVIVTLTQGAGGLTMDCRTPATYPRPLSVSSGVIIGGSWSRTRPTAEKVVVGLGGQGTERTFIEVDDATLRPVWGFTGEAYRDARDVATDDPDAPDWQATATARGAESLADAAAQYKLDLTLTDTEAFAFGVTYDVGDTVPVELNTDITVTDSVTAVQLAYSRDQGLVITPTVGEGSDVIGQQAAAIDRLFGLVQDLRVST